MIRIVKERQKTLRERLDDEFAKERALQITEPLYVTVKHALRKDERLRKWREEKKLALDAGVSSKFLMAMPIMQNLDRLGITGSLH